MTEQERTSVFQEPLEQLSLEDRSAALGAMLFVSSSPVSIGDLARQLGCREPEVHDAAEHLRRQLPTVGLSLQTITPDSLQLVTDPRLSTVLHRFMGLERIVRLSPAALEALAIIAYRQPVTRADLEAIRGVDSSGVVQTLIARGLIEPVGRLATVGSPVIYETTAEFLRYFGLMSLEELPPLPEEFLQSSAALLEQSLDQ